MVEALKIEGWRVGASLVVAVIVMLDAHTTGRIRKKWGQIFSLSPLVESGYVIM